MPAFRLSILCKHLPVSNARSGAETRGSCAAAPALLTPALLAPALLAPALLAPALLRQDHRGMLVLDSRGCHVASGERVLAASQPLPMRRMTSRWPAMQMLWGYCSVLSWLQPAGRAPSSARLHHGDSPQDFPSWRLCARALTMAMLAPFLSRLLLCLSL
jgi:hypothetical protein